MTTNVIKQIVNEGEYGAQTIRMVVQSNERGPQGPKGEDGVDGKDGVIQYTAGSGIDISPDNVISATGGGGSGINVVQTTGTSRTDVMSQNAVTTALSTAGKNYRAGNGITIDQVGSNYLINAAIYPNYFFTSTSSSSIIATYWESDSLNASYHYFSYGNGSQDIVGPLINIQLKGNCWQNGTPTTSNPIPIKTVTGTQIVEVFGPNLFMLPNTKQIKNGITYTPEHDGWFSLDGTATADTEFTITALLDENRIIPGWDYIIDSSASISSSSLQYAIVSTDGLGTSTDILRFNSTGVQTASQPSAGNYVEFKIIVKSGASFIDNFIRVEVAHNDIYHPTEKIVPYTPAQRTTISLSDIELCSVYNYDSPSRKGGTDYIYADESGGTRTWKLFKATAKIDSYNGETINNAYKSTTGQLSTGATVYYVKDTPTITTITDDDLIEELETLAGFTSTSYRTFVATSVGDNDNMPVQFYSWCRQNVLAGMLANDGDIYKALAKLESEGSGPTVVQTTGTSTTSVMSQNATTSALKTGYKLKDSDANYDPEDTGSDTDIAAWRLPSGIYRFDDSLSVDVYIHKLLPTSLISPEGWLIVTQEINGCGIMLVTETMINAFTVKHIEGDPDDGDLINQDDFVDYSGLARKLASNYIQYGSSAPSSTTAGEQIGMLYIDDSTNDIYQLANIDDTDPSNPVYTWAKLPKATDYVISGAGAPTTATVGTVGLLYEDTTNGDLYQCTDATNPYVWEQVGGGGGGPTVVQTTGTSQSNVMSQNAVSSMVFADPGTDTKVQIGSGASVSTHSYNMAIGTNSSANGTQGTAVGYSAKARPNGTALGYNAQAGTSSSQTNTTAIGQSAYGGGDHCTAIGDNTNTINSYSTAVGASARARSERSLAIGAGATVDNSPTMAYSVALGANSKTTRAGEVNVGTGDPAISTYGYNSSAYRVIGGVYDGQDLHDAATVAQGNTLATAAPDTSTVGVLGQLWTDTTNMHTYQCTAISGSTYTWTQRW